MFPKKDVNFITTLLDFRVYNYVFAIAKEKEYLIVLRKPVMAYDYVFTFIKSVCVEFLKTDFSIETRQDCTVVRFDEEGKEKKDHE